MVVVVAVVAAVVTAFFFAAVVTADVDEAMAATLGVRHLPSPWLRLLQLPVFGCGCYP